MKRIAKLLMLLALTSAGAPAASVDGIAIHSTVTGKGPQTVILVHGWTCDETTWSEQVPVLAAHHRVVTIDLPGHGKSPAPADTKLSINLFARAVEAVRTEVGAERVVLVGHSMGTPVIEEYAALYPKHVSALVFVDGVVTLGGRPPSIPDFSGEEGRKTRENMVRAMFSPADTPALRSKIEQMMMASPESTATGAMQAMFEPDKWQGATLTLPILGLYADKSALRHPDFMKEHFPHFEYHEIPGTGHFLMLEKPAEFNRLLIGFLAHQNF